MWKASGACRGGTVEITERGEFGQQEENLATSREFGQQDENKTNIFLSAVSPPPPPTICSIAWKIHIFVFKAGLATAQRTPRGTFCF